MRPNHRHRKPAQEVGRNVTPQPPRTRNGSAGILFVWFSFFVYFDVSIYRVIRANSDQAFEMLEKYETIES